MPPKKASARKSGSNGTKSESRFTKERLAPRTGGNKRFVVCSNGRVVAEELLKLHEIPHSSQIFAEDFKGIQIIPTPFDLTRLMNWVDASVAHNAAVRTKVQDAFGRGWDLDAEDDTSIDADRDELFDFFNRVNPKEDITALAKKVGFDFESNGNGILEVVREPDAEHKAFLFHIPSQTIRITKDRDRFVQQIGQKKVWFKHFGDTRVLDKTTGVFKEVSDPGKAATELIVMKQYTWRSTHYGLPDWLPAVFPMFGEQKEKEYNLEFFANFGIPAYAVMLEGFEDTDPNEDGKDDIEDSIKKYFETDIKLNLHKTMVFRPPSGGKVTFQALNIQKKEASFRMFRRDNRDDILTAHRVPPYRAGIVVQGQLGGTVTAEIDRIYLTSVINPRQRQFEWILTNLIIQELFEIEGWTFVFDDILIDDRKLQSEIDKTYLQIGAKTPNEIREELGFEPYDGGDQFFIAVPGAGASEEEIGEDKMKKVMVVGTKRKKEDVVEKQRFEVDEDTKTAALTREAIKAYTKEFRRQGRELIKFFEENQILERIEADARRKNPEAFEKGKAVFYEEISKQSPEDIAAVNAFVSGWEERLTPAQIGVIAATFAKRAGNLGGAQGLRKMGFRIKFDLKDPALIGALESRGALIGGGVSAKTLQDFRAVLVREFYEKGASIPQVKRQIKNLFNETYKNRAETIARTETGIAQATIQHETYKKNGVEFKQWITFIDGKEREDHNRAHNQLKALDEKFDVGGEDLEHPRDPVGSAGNIINCRCSERPVVKEERRERESLWTGG